MRAVTRRLWKISQNIFEPTGILFLLRVYWVVLLLYGELGVFYNNISETSWPVNNNWNLTIPEARLEKIVIVGDPQIVDTTSHGNTGLMLTMEKIFTDIYMKKHYYYIMKQKRPDRVVFMGDLIDGGREWVTSIWLKEWNRFLGIFRAPNYMDRSKDILYLAGNHDIGVGDNIVKLAVHRFRQYVGPLNFVVDIGEKGGVELVGVNSIGLDSKIAEFRLETEKFLRELNETRRNNQKKRILFTHVPLYRDRDVDCGPLRQGRGNSAIIRNERGYQYQNLISKRMSKQILESVNPDLVVSGDDHDSCVVKQWNGEKLIEEHTVGAFGWASGIPRPAVTYLTVYTGADGQSDFRIRSMLLHDQMNIYRMYLWSLAGSIVIVLVVSIFMYRRPNANNGWGGGFGFGSTSGNNKAHNGTSILYQYRRNDDESRNGSSSTGSSSSSDSSKEKAAVPFILVKTFREIQTRGTIILRKVQENKMFGIARSKVSQLNRKCRIRKIARVVLDNVLVRSIVYIAGFPLAAFILMLMYTYYL